MQVELDEGGWHTPFLQVPPLQVASLVQVATHWPLTHDLPPSHSLAYLQTLALGVHWPAVQTWSAPQSVAVAHGQGPLSPPQDWQVPLTQIFPLPQSVLVVHSLVVPGVVVGDAQTPDLHTVPRSQSPFAWQLLRHPVSVQTVPLGQLAWPVHATGVGAATVTQPRPSHEKQPLSSQ